MPLRDANNADPPEIPNHTPTYGAAKQVVVRPLEAVARMAAPFLSQPQQVITSRENTRRGHELLDNALAFRMPGAFPGRSHDSCPTAAADDVSSGGTGAGDGALRAINGNSPPPPPRVHPPAAGSSGASTSKRGRAVGRLGAVKLALTPPRGGERQPRPSSTSPPPTRERGGSCIESCASPPEGAAMSRRVSVSSSPARRRGLAGAFASVLPFGGGGGDGGGDGRSDSQVERPPSPCGTPLATPHRAVVEGSYIDLRKLDRAKGRNQPRAYRCRDGSFVVLGSERMLSVRPGEKEAARGAGAPPAPGSGAAAAAAAAGQARGGIVTWVLRYGELDSCCINVSAAKESERSVGDVVVEVVSR